MRKTQWNTNESYCKCLAIFLQYLLSWLLDDVSALHCHILGVPGTPPTPGITTPKGLKIIHFYLWTSWFVIGTDCCSCDYNRQLYTTLDTIQLRFCCVCQLFMNENDDDNDDDDDDSDNDEWRRWWQLLCKCIAFLVVQFCRVVTCMHTYF